MVNSREQNKRDVSDPFRQLGLPIALPALKSARLIDPLFEDSTHQLWWCETELGEMVLKLCHQERLQDSSTWQIMQLLFDTSLAEELANFRRVQEYLSEHSTIPVPELIACAGQKQEAPAFILSRAVEGEPILQSQLTHDIVCQLAQQVASLHSQTQSSWGKLTQAEQPAEEWPAKLLHTFLRFSSKLPIAEPWLYKVMAQIEQITPSVFAPVMMDNRWDQYLSKQGRITALVDLDAFVIAPAELELVLLEYQLSKQQAMAFKNEYEKILPLPDLSQQRLTYRLLLFLMNALGATDLDKWMRATKHW